MFKLINFFATLAAHLTGLTLFTGLLTAYMAKKDAERKARK